MISYQWYHQGSQPLLLRTFLFQQGVTRTLLKRIKYHGGSLLVNQIAVHSDFSVQPGALVQIILPPEPQNPVLQVSDLPIEILLETENYLVVNKPVPLATVPSRLHPRDTLANRVLGYFVRSKAASQVIHVVNRLDRETSGPVIFAKNALAHAILDQKFQTHEIHKFYVAGLQGRIPWRHAEINLPLGRMEGSFLKRTVRGDGKPSRTEFWRERFTTTRSLVKVQLHTGRTHQIRVHFAALGYPLLGDWLYNDHPTDFSHQALHCYQMSFWSPLDRRQLTVTVPLPAYFQTLIPD
ncbi:RluA family pseudouridine synthase [Fructilactobacillus florum]|uniref:Pseudouridine synthase n=1 Tax=Fructilactobacillus florum DSM 22689 = JCM 16035 TaxID=1423745 RepID=A0A0R2CP24_9LACO|nr:RluA family pseudouridine synthase [Fructilactobacillus florum]KRM91636.1 hypothetical protein FC87_GL000771 [Fructilactobacillus florum DSM 22689 = JCM 16035]